MRPENKTVPTKPSLGGNKGPANSADLQGFTEPHVQRWVVVITAEAIDDPLPPSAGGVFAAPAHRAWFAAA